MPNKVFVQLLFDSMRSAFFYFSLQQTHASEKFQVIVSHIAVFPSLFCRDATKDETIAPKHCLLPEAGPEMVYVPKGV